MAIDLRWQNIFFNLRGENSYLNLCTQNNYFHSFISILFFKYFQTLRTATHQIP